MLNSIPTASVSPTRRLAQQMPSLSLFQSGPMPKTSLWPELPLELVDEVLAACTTPTLLNLRLTHREMRDRVDSGYLFKAYQYAGFRCAHDGNGQLTQRCPKNVSEWTTPTVHPDALTLAEQVKSKEVMLDVSGEKTRSGPTLAFDLQRAFAAAPITTTIVSLEKTFFFAPQPSPMLNLDWHKFEALAGLLAHGNIFTQGLIDLSVTSPLLNLRFLDLAANGIGDTDWLGLAPNLEYLDLSTNYIGQRDLIHLRLDLVRNLKVLKLGRNFLRDSKYTEFLQHNFGSEMNFSFAYHRQQQELLELEPNLHRLQLSYVPNLQLLDLRENYLTDEGLEQLPLHAVPNLHRLQVYNKFSTTTGYERLRANLPSGCLLDIEQSVPFETHASEARKQSLFERFCSALRI